MDRFNSSANQYVREGFTSWRYRSFCAGWADADMRLANERKHEESNSQELGV
jgi:hypothetical protein